MQYSDVDDTFGPNMLVNEEATADYSFDTMKKEVNANKRFDINLKEKHHTKMLYSDEDDTVDPNMLVRKEATADYTFDKDEEEENALKILYSDEDDSIDQNRLVKNEATAADNVNVEFTKEEVKLVVDILDQKDKELSKIKQKLVGATSSHNRDEQTAASKFSAEDLTMLEAKEGAQYQPTENRAHYQPTETENRAQYQPSETENRNFSPRRRQTCLCGEGTPPPRGFRSNKDSYRATESKLKEKALRNQNKMRNENEDTAGNERGQEDRIVNGYRADSKPWMASFGSIKDGVLQASCGGALINHRFVL